MLFRVRSAAALGHFLCTTDIPNKNYRYAPLSRAEHLLLKVDRKYKKPKPGKKRLVKFPRTLLLCPDQAWDEVSPEA